MERTFLVQKTVITPSLHEQEFKFSRKTKGILETSYKGTKP